MSRRKENLFTNFILLGLSIFLCAGPLAAALTPSSGPVGATGTVGATDGSTAQAIVPAPPGDVRAKLSPDGTEVTISWSRSKDDFWRRVPAGGNFGTGGSFFNYNNVAGYNVWRSADGSEPTLLGSVSAGSVDTDADPTSLVDDSLLLGATYTYSVTAVSRANGEESAAAEADPQIDLGPSPGLTLSVDEGSISEEGSPTVEVTVTATLDRPWSLATPVNLMIADTGTTEQGEDLDFTATWTEQTITIAAGEETGSTTLTLNLNDDNLAEGDVPETIVVEGTSEVSGGAGGATATLEVTGVEIEVTDNDVAPDFIVLRVSQASFTEGETPTVTVTAQLGDGSTALLNDTEVTVSVAASDENAEASASLTIPARETSVEGDLSLQLIDENLVDGNKTISLEGRSGDYTIDAVEIEVADNDVAPDFIVLSVNQASFTEGETPTVTVTAQLGDGSTALLNDTEVTVSVAASDENAEASASLTIPARETSVEGDLSLQLIDENLVDGNKTISLEGRSGDYTIDAVEIEVADNDVAPDYIVLRVSQASFTEGETPTVTVTAQLGDGSTALLNDTEVTVSVAASDENAEASASLTIPARETSVEGDLSLQLIDENLVDGNKTISLEGRSGDYTIDAVEIEVADNDVAPDYIVLRVSQASFTEGETPTVTVTAQLGDGSTALLNDTEVTVSVAASDENAEASASLTIPARETSVEGDLSLQLIDENLVDGNKTISLEGQSGDYRIDAVALMVDDNDVAPDYIVLSVNQDSFTEGETSTIGVTAQLGDGSTVLLNDTEVTVSVAGSDENAAATSSLTIPAGETTVEGELSLQFIDENLLDGNKTISLEGQSSGDHYIAVVALTVTDNDMAPKYIELTVDQDSFTEGDETTVTVTAQLGDGETALLNDTEVAVSVDESDENAAATSSLTIPAGETTVEGELSLRFIDENLLDGNKTIELNGTADGYDIVPVELQVADNDVAPTTITLRLNESNLVEGTGGDVAVTAQLGDGNTVLLNDTEVILSVAGSADIDAATAILTIPAGGTEGSAMLSLSPVDDNLVEDVETIMLEGTATGYTINSVELSLTDNDDKPTTISLSVENSSFREDTGGTLEVTAVLGNGDIVLLEDIEVGLSVAESADNDAAATTLTIAAGAVTGSASLSLSLVNDDLAEGDETISLEGSANGYDIAPVALTVTDDDKAPTTITLSVNKDSFDEGDGETSVEVTAVLGNGITALLTDTAVSLSLSGTAEEGTDYTASIPTIIIEAGTTENTGILTLTPPDELIPEYDETIVVEGSADGFTVGSVTLTLTDNDDEPTRVDPIPAMMLYVGGADGVEEVSDNFRGLDLTYSATSTNPGVATVSMAGSEVTVKAVIEGESTIEVVAMNSLGPDASQTFVVTVVTEADEVAIVGDALAALGRSTLSSVSAAFGTRFGSRPGATKVNLAGHSLTGGNTGAPPLAATHGFGLEEGYVHHPRGLGFDGLSWKQILRNSSFAVPMGSGEADQGLPSWTLWGLGDYQTFEGTPDYGSHDGTVMTVYLGADKRVTTRGQAGVSVSYSMGETDYAFSGDGASGDGTLTTVLTSVYPYVRWAPTSGMDIWALGGVGTGTAENERGVTSTTEESDLSMSLGLLGVRQSLGTMGGLDMALRGDAGMVNLSSAEGDEILDGQEVAGQRFRLGLEGARTLQMVSCATLTPFGELSGRFDGGDGQTGGGLEVAGGVRYKCSRSRLQVEARGRLLALNSAYQERGGSIIATIGPGSNGLGLSMSLAPRWGAADRGAQALWRDDALQTGRFGLSSDDWSMDALVGYSMRVRPLQGVLTPFAEFGPVSADRSLMRLGFRLGGFSGTAFEMVDLNLSGGRAVRDQQSAEHRIDVRGAVRF